MYFGWGSRFLLRLTVVGSSRKNRKQLNYFVEGLFLNYLNVFIGIKLHKWHALDCDVAVD